MNFTPPTNKNSLKQKKYGSSNRKCRNTLVGNNNIVGMHESGTGNVKVYCRIRPQNQLEISHGGHPCLVTQDASVEIMTDDNNFFSFTFDHIFDGSSTQEEVFHKVANPFILDILQGYNATVFCYGQTASGKTYTMEGANLKDPLLQGIIPRTSISLFQSIRESDGNLEFIVTVSFIEIYMEKVRDLLDPYCTKTNLQIRSDPKKGIYVDGATEISITMEEELLVALEQGTDNRAVAATGMNEGSSRSHSVFMVTLNQRNLETQGIKTGKLFLVDLAGSEMVRKTGASGQQLEEAKTINKSLSALGQVINALTDPSSTHIPYRDSKLTRILQDSLGGNSRTALIINVSPSSYNTLETISTLRFGSSAKNIRNKPIVNEEKSVDEFKFLLEKAEKEIIRQRAYILSLENRNEGNNNNNEEELSPVEMNEDDTLEEDVSFNQNLHVNVSTMIQSLQDELSTLVEQLSEEKEESKRKSYEIISLTGLLKKKDLVLNEKEKEIIEYQKTKEFEIATLTEQMNEIKLEELNAYKIEFEKLQYEFKELSVHSETLTEDNKNLLQEIESFSCKKNDNLKESDQFNVEKDDDNRITFDQDNTNNMNKDINQWIKEKEFLQRELNERNDKISDLYAELDRIHTSNSFSYNGSGMTANEREKMRQGQQKLDGLINIHRGLLRRYGSLENEYEESKKKLILKDDRIQKLETQNHNLSLGMKEQAKRYNEEVLRWKNESREMIDKHHQTIAIQSIPKSSQEIMNQTIRPIRGGGGKIPSNQRQNIPNLNDGGQKSLSGLFTRLFYSSA